mmetsp:Transcript_55293/g.131879  ORF Transcript_55293/g.131879 Transcript_55293/m.131879 type:complete len:401 (-) Transcript_55293:1966-3168(-)
MLLQQFIRNLRHCRARVLPSTLHQRHRLLRKLCRRIRLRTLRLALSTTLLTSDTLAVMLLQQSTLDSFPLRLQKMSLLSEQRSPSEHTTTRSTSDMPARRRCKLSMRGSLPLRQQPLRWRKRRRHSHQLSRWSHNSSQRLWRREHPLVPTTTPTTSSMRVQTPSPASTPSLPPAVLRWSLPWRSLRHRSHLSRRSSRSGTSNLTPTTTDRTLDTRARRLLRPSTQSSLWRRRRPLRSRCLLQRSRTLMPATTRCTSDMQGRKPSPQSTQSSNWPPLRWKPRPRQRQVKGSLGVRSTTLSTFGMQGRALSKQFMRSFHPERQLRHRLQLLKVLRVHSCSSRRQWMSQKVQSQRLKTSLLLHTTPSTFAMLGATPSQRSTAGLLLRRQRQRCRPLTPQIRQL